MEASSQYTEMRGNHEFTQKMSQKTWRKFNSRHFLRFCIVTGLLFFVLGTCLLIWKRETYGHQEEINSVDWSADGTRLITGASDGLVKTWDVQTHHPDQTIVLHETNFFIRCSPQGSNMAVAHDFDGVSLWDIDSGKEQKHFDSSVWAEYIAWHPEGILLAIAADYHGLCIYDTLCSEIKLNQSDFPFLGSTYCFEWNSEGTLLAIGQINQTSIFQIEDYSATCISQIQEPASALTWSPDGSQLATKYAGTIKIWEIPSGSLINEFRTGSACRAVEWSSKGGLLASHNDTCLQVWNASTGIITYAEQIGTIGHLSAWHHTNLEIAVSVAHQLMLFDVMNGSWKLFSSDPVNIGGRVTLTFGALFLGLAYVTHLFLEFHQQLVIH